MAAANCNAPWKRVDRANSEDTPSNWTSTMLSTSAVATSVAAISCMAALARVGGTAGDGDAAGQVTRWPGSAPESGDSR